MYESCEKTEEKRYQNIENEQYLYFVIILLFVLVEKHLKNDATLMVHFFKVFTITIVWRHQLLTFLLSTLL